jgi:hypothetical protein
MRQHSRCKRLLSWWSLLVIPLGLLILAAAMREGRTPYWHRSNADPTYPYLFNALTVAELSRPHLVEHPGTTIHMIGAAAIRMRHWLVGTQPLPHDLLLHPESYARVVSLTLIGIMSLALLVAGALVLAATGDLALALLVQATPLLSRLTWGNLFKVAPEPILVAIASLLGGLAVVRAVRPPWSDRGLAAAAGILVGLGLATKLVFLPLALLPWLLLEGRKSRALYAASAGTTFAVATWPGWSALGRMVSFAVAVATGRDLYRSTERGYPALSEYLASVYRLLTLDPLLTVLLLLSLAGALFFSVAPDLAGIRRGLLAAAGVGLLQVALSAKDPFSAPRYLLPLVGVLGVNSALLMALARRRPSRFSFGGLLVVVLMAVGARNGYALARQQQDIWMQRRTLASLSDAIAAADNCRVVHYRGSSSLEWALHFGDLWSGHRYADVLQGYYPNVLVYDIEGASFLRFGQRMAVRGLAVNSSCVLMRGYAQTGLTRLNATLPAEFDLTAVQVGGGEGVYRLRTR